MEQHIRHGYLLNTSQPKGLGTWHGRPQPKWHLKDPGRNNKKLQNELDNKIYW